MEKRAELLRRGLEIRRRLAGGKEPVDPVGYTFVPGLGQWITEALFGGVWARPALEMRYRSLATISVLATLQRLPQLRSHINYGLNLGLTAQEIAEALAQLVFYAGLPAALNALDVAWEVFQQRGLALPPVALPEKDEPALVEEGRARRAQVMGGSVEAAYPAVAALAPDLQRLMAAYAWGLVWGRPGLDTPSRVVVALASCAAQGPTAEANLRSFLRGALRAGFTKEQVAEVLVHTAFYTGFPSALRALTVAHEELGRLPPGG